MPQLQEGRPLAAGEIVDLLSEARARTWLLVSTLEPEDLRRQHDPLMSPILWDLGHIGHFEEVWLHEKLGGGSATGDGEGLRGIYNPFENPRASRDRLALPTAAELQTYLGEVRRRVEERLRRADAQGDPELLAEGYVYRLVLQHEYQHNETILQTLKLKQGREWMPPRVRAFPDALERARELEGAMVRIEGGRVDIGTDDRSAAYDNERPCHTVELQPFEMDVAPVSNRAFARFVDAGGYHDASLWSSAGWAWREQEGLEAPRFWVRDGDTWGERRFDRLGPLRADHPVCHVSHHEAAAYARFVDRRLPTEQEWEAAATWDGSAGRARRFPWGDDPPDGLRTNLDALAFDTAPVGAFPEGAAPSGCEQMIGDVWEWTASDFEAYPGFRAFPYREYSEVFFGDEYKVLRGGSWATRPGAIRGTFRNWDYPIRRQIFAGFRCARDVG
ncbi:MAG: ergothioneine biosynthesis protein EgtB [Gemmatimonadetes bacterium]|nr:ergothioneine biosynthesis protein EgtB [Gemmatimonadota bacterium]